MNRTPKHLRSRPDAYLGDGSQAFSCVLETDTQLEPVGQKRAGQLSSSQVESLPQTSRQRR